LCLAVVVVAVWLMLNKKETPAKIIKKIEDAVEVHDAVATPVPETKDENTVVSVKIKKPRKPRVSKKAAAATEPTTPTKPKASKKAK
jgi:hypothetical protein